MGFLWETWITWLAFVGFFAFMNRCNVKPKFRFFWETWITWLDSCKMRKKVVFCRGGRKTFGPKFGVNVQCLCGMPRNFCLIEFCHNIGISILQKNLSQLNFFHNWNLDLHWMFCLRCFAIAKNFHIHKFFIISFFANSLTWRSLTASLSSLTFDSLIFELFFISVYFFFISSMKNRIVAGFNFLTSHFFCLFVLFCNKLWIHFIKSISSNQWNGMKFGHLGYRAKHQWLLSGQSGQSYIIK